MPQDVQQWLGKHTARVQKRPQPARFRRTRSSHSTFERVHPNTWFPPQTQRFVGLSNLSNFLETPGLAWQNRRSRLCRDSRQLFWKAIFHSALHNQAYQWSEHLAALQPLGSCLCALSRWSVPLFPTQPQFLRLPLPKTPQLCLLLKSTPLHVVQLLQTRPHHHHHHPHHLPSILHTLKSSSRPPPHPLFLL